MEFHRPDTLEDALERLAQPGARLLAGGTDLGPEVRRGARPGSLVAVRRVPELHGIRVEQDSLRIGAAVTVSALLRDALVARHAPLLREAADRFAGPQVRSLATIGGNICRASPAADLAPPLLVLDAEVEIAGPGGFRRLPLTAFFLGPGATALAQGELLVGVRVPLDGPSRGAFLKGGTRPAMDIAVVSVAVLLDVEGGFAVRPRIALGAVAPTPRRSPAAEGAIACAPATEETARRAAREACSDAAPISDVRASAAYRAHLLDVLVRRALLRAFDA